MKRWMDEKMDEKMDGWTDGWINGWIHNNNSPTLFGIFILTTQGDGTNVLYPSVLFNDDEVETIL